MGVSAQQVGLRIGDLDLVGEAGVVREEDRQWTLTIRNRPNSAADIASTVIRSDGGRIVRVSDVATVRDTWEDARSYHRINARPAVRLVVTKEIGANAVRVADRVKERMEAVEARNPPNTRFILNADESREIRRVLSDLSSRAAVSVFVILGVLLVFLGSVRTAFVIFASIAFSILITLNVIHFTGLTLNVLTLMGLALAFGLIVDNAIVVLENVYRRWQEGEPRRTAILRGASDVVLPVIASTATTLIVFAPFVYLQGELRVYYLPLAMVVVLTLIASRVVAFSFIPALVGRILPAREDAGAASRKPLYIRFYERLLGLTLLRPWLVIAIGLAALGGSTWLFQNYVRSGVLWGGGGSGSTYISIQIGFRSGSGIERTDELTRFFEDRLREMPEVKEFVTRVGESQSSIRVTFPRELEHTNIPPAIKDQLFAYSLGFSGVDVRVYGYGPSFYGGGSNPPRYRIQVLGYNYEKVREIAEDLGGRLERYPRIRDVNTNASYGFLTRDRASQFVVDIRRDVVAQHDLPVSSLVRQITAAVRGQVSSTEIKIGGDEVRYDVKLEGNREVDLHRLRQTLILTPANDPVRLGELVTIAPQEVLAQIRRENQQYERTVAYEFRGPYKLGDLYHSTIINGTEGPPGYTVKEADSWRWSTEDQSQLLLVLSVALLLVYMVTAALFESVRQPLCVVLTVPMALIGVFLLFFFIDAQFTREAWMGVIMMCGIVVNNSILLVDHINRLRREHSLGLEEAIVQGTRERVRPILMTTTTTVLGLLPLVLFSETADSNIWNALAYSVIGGLLSSTFLVLTATPALYFLFESPKGRATISEHFGTSGTVGWGEWGVKVALYLTVMVGFVFGALALWNLVEGLRGDVDLVESVFSLASRIPDALQGPLIVLGILWAALLVSWPFVAITIRWVRGLRTKATS